MAADFFEQKLQARNECRMEKPTTKNTYPQDSPSDLMDNQSFYREVTGRRIQHHQTSFTKKCLRNFSEGKEKATTRDRLRDEKLTGKRKH